MANIFSKLVGAFTSAGPAGAATDAVGAVTGLIKTIHPTLTPEEKQQADQFTATLAAHADDVNAAVQVQLAQVAEADTASARARQAAVKDRVIGFLAVYTAIGFTLCLILVAFKPVPTMNQTVVGGMTGTFGSAFMLVIGYYFGSSSGDVEKTQILTTQMRRGFDSASETKTKS